MKRGFTLIELLVVITIIVLLLALLTPALDRAIYQAELTVCEATLHSVGMGATTYTIDFKRRYPHRPAVFDTSTGFQADALTYPFSASGQRNDTNGYDDRPTIRDHVQMKALICALAGDIDLDSSPRTTWVFANYAMWFGWKWRIGGSGMLKLGDRLSWTDNADPPVTYRFNVLAADHTYNLPSLDVIETSHPDVGNGVLSFRAAQDEFHPNWAAAHGNPDIRETRSLWNTAQAGGYSRSGVKDLNYVFADGSVRRYDAVDHHLGADTRMVEVPNTPEGQIANFYQLLPD